MKSKEECRFYSEGKCIAADLELCDFKERITKNVCVIGYII